MKIEIKVIPKASKSEVVGFEGNVLKIRCKSPPEKGKANAEVIALLAKYFKVAKSQISILRGSKSSKKIVEIIK